MPIDPPEVTPEETEAGVQAADSLKTFGAIMIAPPPHDGVQCLTIIGEIEGHTLLPPTSKTTKYEHLIPLLASIEQNPEIKGVLFLMNTVGGDIEAGLAIAELIAGMSKPTVTLVLGGGHSIGVTLAVSSRASFITPTATITIHPVRISGQVITASQTYDYFNRMQDRILEFIVRHSNIKLKALRALMLNTSELANDIGTVLIGKEAVDCGLIGAIGGIKDAREKLMELIELYDEE